MKDREMNEKRKYKAIFWDWNGTLLDDVLPSLNAVNDLLELYKKEKISLEQYYSYVDTPIYKFYERIFDLNEVPMSVIKPHYIAFYERYENDVNLAIGAIELLEKCKENGMKMYVISAAHIDDLTKHAKRLGAYEYFDKISAATDYDAGSKIDRALKLLEDEKIDRNEAIMIGDTLHDLHTAEAIGIECLLYSKGHTDFDTLNSTKKTVLSDFAEIEQYIFSDIAN